MLAAAVGKLFIYLVNENQSANCSILIQHCVFCSNKEIKNEISKLDEMFFFFVFFFPDVGSSIRKIPNDDKSRRYRRLIPSHVNF